MNSHTPENQGIGKNIVSAAVKGGTEQPWQWSIFAHWSHFKTCDCLGSDPLLCAKKDRW